MQEHANSYFLMFHVVETQENDAKIHFKKVSLINSSAADRHIELVDSIFTTFSTL